MNEIISSFRYLFLIFLLPTTLVLATPLDDYVNLPDPSYAYNFTGSISGPNFTVYLIQMTSQTWLTAKDSSRPVWKHWLSICVPNEVAFDTGFVYIDGGKNTDTQPGSVNPLIELLCSNSKMVVAGLQQIPNEPITFADGISRSEDAIIAYTWSHFINDTSQPFWLVRLPMTKAVVRAMDTIQHFLAPFQHVIPVKNFIVSGASKRGWTTWTTAAVDKRVIAIAPIVIPVLNIVPNMNHQWQAYGNWSFALEDYLNMDIMHYLNMPVFEELAAIEDPWSYNSRLTMPKYIMCATGDEFFLPDSSEFFFSGLYGENYLRIVPDAEHSMEGHEIDLALSVNTWMHMILTGKKRPTFTWNLEKSNDTARITVKCDEKPSSVTMWYAHTLSHTRRDFRLLTCEDIPKCIQPVIWWYKALEDQGNGVYVAEMEAPFRGWSGFFVEMIWRYSYDPFGPEQAFKATTEVNIVPDTLPFPPCGDHCQN